jgi:hypothetical protein
VLESLAFDFMRWVYCFSICSGVVNSAACVPQLPLPVYGLVQADIQWTSLGAQRQQQLRSSAHNSIGSPDSSAHSTPVRHHLNYLSTGTMNVLRSGALPLPYNPTQPVTNQRLDDLLTMWDILNTHPLTRQKSFTSEDETSEIERIRGEINQDVSTLHLENPAFGPLVVPGPTQAYCGASSADGTTPGKTFSYHMGWPALSDEYTQHALERAIHPALAAIRALRKNYETQVGGCEHFCWIYTL